MSLGARYIAVALILIAPSVVAGFNQPVAMGSDAQEPLGPIGPSGSSGQVLEDGLLEVDHWPHGVIVHFGSEARSDGSVAGQDEAAWGHVDGFDVRYAFENIPALYGLAADPATVQSMARTDTVTFIEDAWKLIEYHLDSATTSSRAREVVDPTYDPPDRVIDEPSPPLLAPDGSPIDGSGIGLAVVDSGLDATHPDFHGQDKVGGNFLATPQGVVQAPEIPRFGTDTSVTLGDVTVHVSALTGGTFSETGVSRSHGTHLAGIAAGTGAASEDMWRKGVAPGSTLYGFSNWLPEGYPVRDGTVLSPAVAYDWILTNGPDQDPPIRIILNGWSCRANPCEELNPDQAHIQLVKELVSDGIVVVFPAGNEGGEGFFARTTPECRIQDPGVLCVANHDDEETGGRTDCTKSASSRGDGFDPSTWPDLGAPGDDVWSQTSIWPQQFPLLAAGTGRVPANAGLEDGTSQRKPYTPVTGTSASAAHLAGVAALVLQANESLDPGQLEHILEATAHELPHGEEGRCVDYARVDPTHPGDGANYAMGHGLVDAVEAVQGARGFPGIPSPPPAVEPFPADWLSHDVGITDLERTFYLEGETSITQEQPGFGAPLVRPLVPGVTWTHTSEPLQQGFTTSGVLGHVWAGCDSCADAALTITVERLPGSGGDPQTLAVAEERVSYSVQPFLTPVQIGAPIGEDVAFSPGDQVEVSVTIVLDEDPLSGVTANENATVASVAVGAQPTASKISFGEATRDVEPGTRTACTAESTCAPIGGDLHTNAVFCQLGANHVYWEGPPGSRATMVCDHSVTTCQVPLDIEGEVGTCSAEGETSTLAEVPGYCTYSIPGDEGPGIGGHGWCADGPRPRT